MEKMITLKNSKDLLLKQIKSKLHWCINSNKEVRFPRKNFRKASPKLMEIYVFISALPVSNHIFKWYRTNMDKIDIELVDDNVRIYKIEAQYLEEVEFGDEDLSNLIYKALGNQN